MAWRSTLSGKMVAGHVHLRLPHNTARTEYRTVCNVECTMYNVIKYQVLGPTCRGQVLASMQFPLHWDLFFSPGLRLYMQGL
jgi:hypothetical protein